MMRIVSFLAFSLYLIGLAECGPISTVYVGDNAAEFRFYSEPADTPHADAVNALNPLAYYKLQEQNPSGAGSIIDETGNYNATPTGTFTQWSGATGDASDKSMRLESEDGSILLPDALRIAMMDGTWTVSFWTYLEPDSGGMLFSLTGGGSNAAIQYSGGSLFSTANGEESSVPNGPARNGWRHIALTSTGTTYVDGNGYTSGSGASVASNNTFRLFNRNDLVSWGEFMGLMSHFAVFDDVLDSSQIIALEDSGRIKDGQRPDMLTLSWDLESRLMSEVAPGVSSYWGVYPDDSIFSTNRARSGSWSLHVNGQWDAAKLWYDIPHEGFAPLNEGTIEVYFNTNTFSGISNQLRILTLDGKTGYGSSPLDGNSTSELRWNTQLDEFRFSVGTRVVTVDAGPLEEDTWYRLVVKWREDAGGEETIYIEANGISATASDALDFSGYDIEEYHSILFGNDLAGTTADYYLDDLRVWNYWNDSL